MGEGACGSGGASETPSTPFVSFLWPGNTADVTRLTPVVERLRKHFAINKVCVVGDRGMISAANIAALEKAHIDYILGVRERSTKEVRTEVIEDDRVTIPLVIPRQRGETQLEIKDVTLRGRRYVLCRNEEEARKDAERRALLLAGLERKLKEGYKALVANKGFRRFVKSRPDKFSIDYEKAENDAKFNGIFVLRTSTASFFAVAICWRLRTPSGPPRHCSRHARSIIGRMRAFAVISFVRSSLSSCGKSSLIVSQRMATDHRCGLKNPIAGDISWWLQIRVNIKNIQEGLRPPLNRRYRHLRTQRQMMLAARVVLEGSCRDARRTL
jgi:hypothetical protein